MGWQALSFPESRILRCAVETQIRVLGGNEPRFKAVMRGLGDLQNYCDSWNTPNFDIPMLRQCFGRESIYFEYAQR